MQHSYFFLMIEYLYACYYTESKEYTKALNIFDTILSHTQTAGSYKSLLILQERAQLLALMGKYEEACQAYESLNTLKDSLDERIISGKSIRFMLFTKLIKMNWTT